ncbi:MAG: tetratricopeptide repeat protein [Chitinophagaceae bacterium]|nr:tetratricopeptide repeat protein [Chitinophagaceae bacterium]
MRIYAAFALSLILFLSATTGLTAQAPAVIAPPKPRDSTIAGPQTFAMIMGISKYKYVRPLTYADKDAELFRDFLKSPAGGKLSDDNIFCLLNDQAQAATFFTKGSKWLDAKKLRQGDKLFIYLAGHGDAIDEDQFFYIAYDCNPAGDKNNYLAGGTVQLYNLKRKIAKETGKGVEVYFIMDACRTSELPGGSDGQSGLFKAISEEREGEVIMLATGAGQESLEDATIGTGHGLFTYFLIDGLAGMADSMGTQDKKTTLAEIQQYIQKNVPAVAREVFKRKQDPFICCAEFNEKVISNVDVDYFKKWQDAKKLSGKMLGSSLVAPRGRGLGKITDTVVIEAYNLFNTAVKENRLTGINSAQFYYDQMAKNYPDDPYTLDAQSTLAVEYINFAQSKINLYLACKDAASIQRIRAQIEEDEKTEEMNASLDRMEKVAQQEFFEVGEMLEKAIKYIMPDDPDFAKTLFGRMYFFKARGYFGNRGKLVDIKTAFNYAYSAYARDKNAAYILNTLSSLHLDNGRIDSAIYYAKQAIAAAPKWRYPYVTLAFSYKTQNKADSAIKYYKRSIEVDPANADAYVDLGHYFYFLSRPDSAISYYQKALSIEPENVYASNNIGWLYHDKKQYANAITYFKKSLLADPKFINAYNGISKTFFEQGMYDSARIYYSKAFEHYQDKSIVNVYLGNFYKDLKQYDSAKVYYRKAAELDPRYEDAFNNLGKVSFTLKQYDSARFYYNRALVANPNSAAALINLGLVFKELKRLDSASYYFESAVNLEPGNASILNNVGVIYGQDKLYDSAKNYFRRALFVRPDYKPASNNMIRIFREQNLLDSITNFIKGFSLVDPDSPMYMNDIGRAFYDQKRFDSARFYFRKGLQKDPTNAQILSNMGLTFQALKMLDSARIYIQRALKNDPENSAILSNMAMVFRQLKKYDSAGYYFRMQMMKRTSPTAQAYLTIGNFYSDMKEYDSAVVYFRMAIKIDPGYAPAYTNTGQSFMELEQNDSAMRYLRRAFQIDPLSYPPAHNLGLLHHSMGHYDSAIYYLKRSIDNDPSKEKAYYQLACSYALNKQTDQAINYLRLSAQKGTKPKDIRDWAEDPDLEFLRPLKAFQDILDEYSPGWRTRGQ